MPESQDSLVRKNLAMQIGSVFAYNPSVDAILLGGSTASGRADRYSDIEVGVFWRKDPSDEERRTAVTQAGGKEYRQYLFNPAEQVWEDDFIIQPAETVNPQDGVLVEVVHYRCEYIDRIIADVIEKYDPDLLKQNLISALVRGIPIHNNERIASWRSRLAVYPEGLAEAVINHNAQIDHFWRWRMWLDRGPNLMMLYSSFSQVEQKLLLTLMGLNHTYYSGFKWIDELSVDSAIAPADLKMRLNKVFEVSPREGAQILAGIVEETYDLVEKYSPKVDVNRLRRIFRYERPYLNLPLSRGEFG